MRRSRKIVNLLGVALLAGPLAITPNVTFAQAANPCAPKAANPCAPKAANPCAPKAANPCAAKPEVDPKLVMRPSGTKLAQGKHADLAKEGKTLYGDTKLSTNGMSCNSCHTNNDNFMPSFAKAYPHEVEMAKSMGGVAKVNLDEMVQFCMVVPMAAKPLPWDSRQLAALTAYTADLQKKFQADTKKAANPCAPKAGNPCSPKAANPCASKTGNPCAKK